VPADRGLVGHSDGDVVLHAICDAMLGAAGLGDIGDHFPDDDPALAGIDSAELVARTLALVRKAGFAPANLDVNIIAEQPRLGPHKQAIRARVADLLGMAPESVSIKARTAGHRRTGGRSRRGDAPMRPGPQHSPGECNGHRLL